LPHNSLPGPKGSGSSSGADKVVFEGCGHIYKRFHLPGPFPEVLESEHYG